MCLCAYEYCSVCIAHVTAAFLVRTPGAELGTSHAKEHKQLQLELKSHRDLAGTGTDPYPLCTRHRREPATHFYPAHVLVHAAAHACVCTYLWGCVSVHVPCVCVALGVCVNTHTCGWLDLSGCVHGGGGCMCVGRRMYFCVYPPGCMCLYVHACVCARVHAQT